MDGVTILPVSVDDLEVWRLLDTDIAVVCVDRRIENARAAELLLRRLSEPDRSATTVMLQPKLVVRHSCGAKHASRPSV